MNGAAPRPARQPRRWPVGGLLLGLALFVGCAVFSPPAFEAMETQTARVDWAHAGGAGTWPVTFETGEADLFRIVVLDEKPVLTLTRARGEWTATGPLARGTWRGTWNTAPPEVAGWLCLAEAFEGGRHAAEGVSEFRTGRMSVRYSRIAGELVEFELAAVASDDRFRVRF